MTRLGINLVPQLANVFADLSVRENLQATAVKRNGDGWTLDNVYELFPRLAERDASMKPAGPRPSFR